MNTKAQKILIWIALVLAGIYSSAFYYLLEFFPPPSPMLGAEQVVQLYAHNNMQFKIGVLLMMLSGAFYLPWAVVISIQMARDEEGIPVWAITQGLASAVATWLFMFPPVMWGFAAFSVDRAPELTLLLHQCAWLTFVTPISFFPFQSFTVAVVGLSKKKDEATSAFPRWMGWLSAWLGVIGTVGGFAIIFKTGPFAWDGLFTFYLPIVVFSIWIGALAYTMLRAIGRQERAAGSDARKRHFAAQS